MEEAGPSRQGQGIVQEAVARAEPLGCPVVLHPVDHLEGEEQRSLGDGGDKARVLCG